MNTEFGTLLGYPAAFLTTIAFVPQAWQSWRTRDLSGISLPMYALFTLGVALWLGYGLAIGSLPVIAANAITLLLSSVVLWLKVAEKKAISLKKSVVHELHEKTRTKSNGCA